MITEHQQELASLYAVGALPPQELAEFEVELTVNSELRGLADRLARTADLIALSAPRRFPPARLRANLLQKIRSAPSSPSNELKAQAGLSFLPSAAAKDWKPLPVPGTYLKLLSIEKERGYAILLGKLDPGARYPAHINAGPEDFLILSGDLVVGDKKLIAGDFHHADKGSAHAENYSTEGCTLIAVLTTEDPLVAFALA